ncbi:MAG: zinc metallopeptidase, partial [Thermosynechococcaceae cyanobacterium MS004]|nr:zinc metallopeptidase [Thermosynechococcaceae cyanobacterium MS004]
LLSIVFSRENIQTEIRRKKVSSIVRWALLNIESRFPLNLVSQAILYLSPGHSSCSTMPIKNGSAIILADRVLEENEVRSAASVLHEFGHVYDNRRNKEQKRKKSQYGYLSFFSVVVFAFISIAKLDSPNLFQGFKYPVLSVIAFSTFVIATSIGYLCREVTLKMEVSASKTAMRLLSDNTEVLNLIGKKEIDHIQEILQTFFQSYIVGILFTEITHLSMLIGLIIIFPVEVSVPALVSVFVLRIGYKPFERLKKISLNFDNYSIENVQTISLSQN